MKNIQWMYGDEPKSLPDDWKEKIKSMFLNETGEEYTLDLEITFLFLTTTAWLKLYCLKLFNVLIAILISN